MLAEGARLCGARCTAFETKSPSDTVPLSFVPASQQVYYASGYWEVSTVSESSIFGTIIAILAAVWHAMCSIEYAVAANAVGSCTCHSLIQIELWFHVVSSRMKLKLAVFHFAECVENCTGSEH